MQTYIVGHDSELKNKLKMAQVGDVIELVTDNQEGNEKYRVGKQKGKKVLELMADYMDMFISPLGIGSTVE
jgi:hypothetical protein